MVTIAIDPGTTSTSVSYTVEGRKEDPTCIVWRNNNKDAANCETPAKFYYRARDGPNKGWDFVCGCDVEVARMNNRIPIEDVIMGLKIATLVQEDFSQQYLQPIVAKLAPIGKTLEDLWYDYFRYLLDKTIKDIKTNERIGEAEWVKMERELLIAMPNLSEPSGNLVFTRVGKRLADRCYIVKEATCGATTVLEDDIKSKPKSGEKVIVLDLGGGFCSPTAHRVRRDTRNGTYFLEDLACSNSQMAGAVFINKDFENELGTWMQDRDQQDLDEVARRLGLTPDIFKLKASECFEKDLKHTFPDAEEYLVQVVNSTNMRNWMMKLFKADIEKLFARWMKKIYEALDELLETVGGSPGFQVGAYSAMYSSFADFSQHVILRGGLASNPWVRNALQQHYTQFSFSLRGTQM